MHTDLETMPEELIFEASYLVARGVRTLAHLATVDAAQGLRAATLLERHGDPAAIAYVIERDDGRADCGFASHQWALDLAQWLEESEVPDEHRHRIMGLLYGYGPGAIARHAEQCSGRRFKSSGSESS